MSDNNPNDSSDDVRDGLDAADIDEPTSADEEDEEPSVSDRVSDARGDPEADLSEKFIEARDADGEGEDESVGPPETDDDEFAAKTTTAIERVVETLKRLLAVPLVAILKYVPRSDVLAGALIKAGIARKQQLARGDGILFVLYGDGALIPQAYTIDSQRKKYITENGGEYSYDAEGHRTWQIGGVPVAFAIKGIPEVLEPAQTYMARQMRQNMKVDVPAFDDQGNQIGYERYVPVTTPNGEDGILANFRSAVETFGQKITREDLEDAREKGFLEAVDGRTGKDKVMWGIAGLAIGAVGTLAVQWLTSQIGGGGGGSIVPLLLDLGVVF